MSPEADSKYSLEPFLEAMKSFKTRYYQQEPEMMRRLSQQGQNPKALVIACCDSRVDPALLFDAQPGDLFVVRNVANLVPPFCLSSQPDGISTAIEYAIRDLRVQHVIVMGHAHCGGVKALLNMSSGQKLNRDFIGNWVSIAERACLFPSENAGQTESVSVEQLMEYPYLVERAAIKGSLKNLLGYPWIKSVVEEGKLELHGWWFDLESGDLWVCDAETETFMPVF